MPNQRVTPPVPRSTEWIVGHLRPSSLCLVVWLTLGGAPHIASLEAQTGPPEKATEVPPDGWWLVTVDGQRIPSRAPWEVRGGRILYTNASGDLVAVRAREIDLEASRLATFPPPREVRPPGEAQEREPVLVLTAKDVARYEAEPAVGVSATGGESLDPLNPSVPGGRNGGPGDSDSDATTSDSAAAVQPAVVPIRKPTASATASLSVVTWRDIAEDYGSSANFLGTVRNDGDRTVEGASLQVVAFDQEGNEMDRLRAQLLSSKLEPGETTTFRAVFSELGPYGEIQFEFQTN